MIPQAKAASNTNTTSAFIILLFFIFQIFGYKNNFFPENIKQNNMGFIITV